MKKYMVLLLSFFLIFFLLVINAYAADRVVVVPMGKTCEACDDNVPATGQVTCYTFSTMWQEDDCAYSSPQGQDGELQNGKAWPVPRFTDNGNGTVTDNLTGLVWLKNANCYGTDSWLSAFTNVNSLHAGYCGLTDGSEDGDWRIPNRNELESLLDLGQDTPALSDSTGTGQWANGDPFFNVVSSYYFTSTTDNRSGGSSAWGVHFERGSVNPVSKGGTWYVWPVRDKKE